VRNVYPPLEPPGEAVAGLARYIRLQADALANQPVPEILNGRVDFPAMADAPQAAPQAGPVAAAQGGMAARPGAGGRE